MPIIGNGITAVIVETKEKHESSFTEKDRIESNGVVKHSRTLVTFLRNDGTGGTYSTQKRTWEVENITNPGSPTRSNYTFKGWYTAASGGSMIIFPKVKGVDAETYYAQWTYNPPAQDLKWRLGSRAPNEFCMCMGYNPVGSSCTVELDTMVVCGGDVGAGDGCWTVVCRRS